MSKFVLDSIELVNIFNYYGKNLIDFTPRREGNVILFDVDNGGGKTSLFLSIKWGFYGNSSTVEYVKDGVVLQNKDFLNADAQREGVLGFRVTIGFHYGADEYKLTRTCENAKQNTSVIDLSCNGARISDEEAQMRLENMIPPDYGDFFMFNGEMLTELATIQKSPKRVEGVLKLLGLKQLKDLVTNLEAVKDKLGTELAKARRNSTNSSSLDRDLNRLYDDIQNYKEIIDTENTKLAGFNSKLIAYENERAEYRDVDEAVNELEEAKAANDQALIKVNNQENSLRNHSENFFKYLLNRDIEKTLATCRKEQDSLSKMASISGEQEEITSVQLSILENHLKECPVCRTSLSTEEFRAIQAILDDSKEKRVRYEQNKSRLTQLREEIAVLNRAIQSNNYDYRSEYDKFNDLIVAKISAEDKLREKEKEVMASDREKVQSLSDLVSQTRSMIDASSKVITANQEYLDIAKDKYDGLEKQKAISSNASTEEKRLSKEIQYLQGMIDDLRNVIDTASLTKRDNILTKANEVFRTLTIKKDTFSHLDYVDDDSFSMKIVDFKGNDVEKPSAGECHILAVSFLVSLALNTESESTMMMDTPGSRLGPGHLANIGKILAGLKNQVIFLAQPNELTDELLNNIEPVVCKKFSATLRHDNHANIREVDI